MGVADPLRTELDRYTGDDLLGEDSAADALFGLLTDPPASKGSSSKPRATSTSCTFGFSQTGFDEEFGQVVTFSLSGSVTGFVTPVR